MLEMVNVTQESFFCTSNVILFPIKQQVFMASVMVSHSLFH